jgi:hypothetical protein
MDFPRAAGAAGLRIPLKLQKIGKGEEDSSTTARTNFIQQIPRSERILTSTSVIFKCLCNVRSASLVFLLAFHDDFGLEAVRGTDRESSPQR